VDGQHATSVRRVYLSPSMMMPSFSLKGDEILKWNSIKLGLATAAFESA